MGSHELSGSALAMFTKSVSRLKSTTVERIRNIRRRAKGGSGHFEVSAGARRVFYQGFGWGVRKMLKVGDEMRKVALARAEAFHEPAVLFSDLFFGFFKADVLSAITLQS